MGTQDVPRKRPRRSDDAVLSADLNESDAEHEQHNESGSEWENSAPVAWQDEEDLDFGSSGSDDETDGDEEDNSQSRSLHKLHKKMASLPFGALAQADQAVSSDSEENDEEEAEVDLRASADEEEELAASENEGLDWKPANERKEVPARVDKSAPQVMSSKKPVPRFRQIVEATTLKARDPRFSSLSGEFSAEKFARSYSFVTDIKKQETSKLRDAVTKASREAKNDPGSERKQKELDQLRRQLNKAETFLRRTEQQAREKEVLSKAMKLEREKREKGKKPWYMKASEKRKLLLESKFEDLATSGGQRMVKKALDKKQRKIAQKEKKSRPFAKGEFFQADRGIQDDTQQHGDSRRGRRALRKGPPQDRNHERGSSRAHKKARIDLLGHWLVDIYVLTLPHNQVIALCAPTDASDVEQDCVVRVAKADAEPLRAPIEMNQVVRANAYPRREIGTVMDLDASSTMSSTRASRHSILGFMGLRKRATTLTSPADTPPVPAIPSVFLPSTSPSTPQQPVSLSTSAIAAGVSASEHVAELCSPQHPKAETSEQVNGSAPARQATQDKDKGKEKSSKFGQRLMRKRSTSDRPGSSAKSADTSPTTTPSSSSNAAAIPPTRYKIRLVPHLSATSRSRPALHFDPIVRNVKVGRIGVTIARHIDPNNSGFRDPILDLEAAALMGVSPLKGKEKSDRITFKSKVVSRTHARLWVDETGQFWLKDVKSSSGTYLNSHRLSPSGEESHSVPIKDGDIIQLGLDFQGGQDEIYRCVRMKVEVGQGREWQGSANAFNMSALQLIRSLRAVNVSNHERSPKSAADGPADTEKQAAKVDPGAGDCCIYVESEELLGLEAVLADEERIAAAERRAQEEEQQHREDKELRGIMQALIMERKQPPKTRHRHRSPRRKSPERSTRGGNGHVQNSARAGLEERVRAEEALPKSVLTDDESEVEEETGDFVVSPREPPLGAPSPPPRAPNRPIGPPAAPRELPNIDTDVVPQTAVPPEMLNATHSGQRRTNPFLQYDDGDFTPVPTPSVSPVPGQTSGQRIAGDSLNPFRRAMSPVMSSPIFAGELDPSSHSHSLLSPCSPFGTNRPQLGHGDDDATDREDDVYPDNIFPNQTVLKKVGVYNGGLGTSTDQAVSEAKLGDSSTPSPPFAVSGKGQSDPPT
ncbi:hypothetical protein FRB99_006925 [Tulasnella sp. 403]|nr:hypothetical protein FRB99_006925 [Tulasnella sp. 403]